MIDPRLLAIIRCPASQAPLELLTDDEVRGINARIVRRELSNLNGQLLERPLDAGLRVVGGRLVYPIWDRLPALIPGEAIET
jgi:uncharacterized protein YbaR (Trm112 family)